MQKPSPQSSVHLLHRRQPQEYENEPEISVGSFISHKFRKKRLVAGQYLPKDCATPTFSAIFYLKSIFDTEPFDRSTFVPEPLRHFSSSCVRVLMDSHQTLYTEQQMNERSSSNVQSKDLDEKNKDPINPWTLYLRWARNCLEHNLTLYSVTDTQSVSYQLRTIRPVPIGQTLCVWPNSELLSKWHVPNFISPANIISIHEYRCDRCTQSYTQPNQLKVHLGTCTSRVFNSKKPTVHSINSLIVQPSSVNTKFPNSKILSTSDVNIIETDLDSTNLNPPLNLLSHSDVSATNNSTFVSSINRSLNRLPPPPLVNLTNGTNRTSPNFSFVDFKKLQFNQKIDFNIQSLLYQQSPNPSYLMPKQSLSFAQDQMITRSHDQIMTLRSNPLMSSASSDSSIELDDISEESKDASRLSRPKSSSAGESNNRSSRERLASNVSKSMKTQVFDGNKDHLLINTNSNDEAISDRMISSSCSSNNLNSGNNPISNGNLEENISGKQPKITKEPRTHTCMFCGKLYTRKYGLKIHVRTHTGHKPLKCVHCSRPFSDPSNLNKHMRLHQQHRLWTRQLSLKKL